MADLISAPDPPRSSDRWMSPNPAIRLSRKDWPPGGSGAYCDRSEWKVHIGPQPRRLDRHGGAAVVGVTIAPATAGDPDEQAKSFTQVHVTIEEQEGNKSENVRS